MEALGLATASDEEVWRFARDNDYLLVSKDADFSEMSLVQGAPPKVIWLRLGNCSTAQLEQALRNHQAAVEALVADPSLSILRVE